MERKAVYKIGGGLDSLSSFKGLTCALPYSSGNYEPPCANEIRSLIRVMGWSQRDVAMITGVSCTNKGSTTVRKWCTEKGDEHRKIPYAAWRLLLEHAGIVSVEESLFFIKS